MDEVQNPSNSNLFLCSKYRRTNHIENTALLLLSSRMFLRERVERAVAQKRPWYSNPSRGRSIATSLHATILKLGFNRIRRRIAWHLLPQS
jgi:hypothetical protein